MPITKNATNSFQQTENLNPLIISNMECICKTIVQFTIKAVGNKSPVMCHF